MSGMGQWCRLVSVCASVDILGHVIGAPGWGSANVIPRLWRLALFYVSPSH